jgi:tetratricopeptide (TPR) repeat protein
MSDSDIQPGQRWNEEVSSHLECARFGIICLTPENLNSPWLLFESGALGKAVSSARVVPLLFDMTESDLTFPLAQFHAVEATRAGFLALAASVNRVLPGKGLETAILSNTFNALWSAFESDLATVAPLQNETGRTSRTDRELLDELLETVRGFSRGTLPIPRTDTPLEPGRDWQDYFILGVNLSDRPGEENQDIAALKAFSDAIAVAPIDLADTLRSRLYSHRGGLLKRLRRLDEAEHDLLLAQKWASENREINDAMYHMAGVKALRGDENDALAILQTLFRRDARWLDLVKARTEYFGKLQDDPRFNELVRTVLSASSKKQVELGLKLISEGEFVEAGECLRRALDLARQDKSRSNEMRALLSLGRLNHKLSNNDEAISQLQEALKFYQPGGYFTETSAALTLLGRAYQEKGEIETALKFFEEQFQLAKGWGDLESLGDSHMNLALLRGFGQERYPEALSHLDEKIKIDERLEAEVRLGFDHMNRGNFLWQLGQYAQARAALDQAFEIADQPRANNKAVLAWVHLARAQMVLSEGNYSEAKQNAQLALDLSTSQFPDVTTQATYCTGRAEAFSGAPQLGRKLCEEAVAMAKKVKDPRLISSALLALAEVLLIANDLPGALENAREALKMLARSGQRDSEWRASLIAARASAEMGNKSATSEYASEAESLCAGLEQKWGKEAYESYLLRPDIQSYRNQVAQMLKVSN